MKTICFTGHRPKELQGKEELVKKTLEKLIRAAYQKNYRRFISGMAMGVDMYAAQIVIELKQEFPDIQLILAIPFPGQTKQFPNKEKNDWNNIVKKADEIHAYNPDKKQYEKFKAKEIIELNENAPQWQYYEAVNWLDKRNKWMIEKSDAVIAVWSGTQKGGTANAIKDAMLKIKPIIIFNITENNIKKYNFKQK